MKKFVRLFFIIFRINLMQEIEFRTNLFVNSLINVGWVFSFLLFTQIVFGHVSAFGGWNKAEVMLLVVTQSLVWGILMFSVVPGMAELPKKIKQGSLDQLLTKPVSARLMLAIYNQNIDDGLAHLPVLFILVIVLSHNLNLIILFSYLLLIILGTFILYNAFFIMHTTAFWLIDLSNINHLSSTLSEVGKYPPEIFTGKLKLFFCYLIPTIFMAAVPTRVLLGEPILPSLILAITVAVITFVLSQWFWKFALKHYSSASS